MDHKFLPDIAIADIAFEAHGKTFEGLLENCGLAMMDAMSDLSKIRARKKKKITVVGADEEKLLYNFLEELVYIKDVDGLLFCKFRATQADARQKNTKGLRMTVECSGDLLGNIGRENLRNDVKAITMHMFKISKTAQGYSATVVVDI